MEESTEQCGREPWGRTRWREEQQKKWEIEKGQCHAGDLELYFLGNRKFIVD